MYKLQNFNNEQFLKHYWQQKPLVIKQGFKNFIDPVDEHLLAGLTEEDEVDSRIVSCDNQKWQVTHGPFDDINQHLLGAWSLLVQSVDHYLPEADQLMRAFDFIPYWRMDDLMVSYSNAQAGVGPHLDQYDVFIIQGKGTRRWQVGLPADFQKTQPHCDLSQITGFEPVIDEVLSAGDILYIPPNHPHNGVALEECLNYSVGFRAPTTQELLSSFADHAIDNNMLTNRYSDKEISTRQYSGEIKQQELAAFKAMLQDALQSDQLEQWLPNFMSQSKVLAQSHLVQDSVTPEQITEELKLGSVFVRAPGIKPVFIEQKAEQDVVQSDTFRFYIEGQQFSVVNSSVANNEAKLVKNFLCNPKFNDSVENNAYKRLFFTQLLSTLVNSGFWYIDE
ncbi:cupin domain-containing protein [Paraglaciecola aquimarina]|uniref:Cupin domain-containing protein n=1 Tax=Paraglaciecola algarum TaxID=3050085 RepID=A0ABS9DEP1_9ALTE|nr:cupin domain-containing protein [Paraglaciecola sp. G1-23]MCF2950244.1 cupin domain-containing protein [Paraglaciecola sp. G1-23]